MSPGLNSTTLALLPNFLERAAQLVGCSLERRERPEVHRDDRLEPEQLGGVGRADRVHREVAADRQHAHRRVITLGDQAHAGKRVGVAGVIEDRPLRDRDDEAHRRAAVFRAGLVLPEPARVHGLDQRMVASLTTVLPPMFIPSELAAPIRLASSNDVITLAPVFLASSPALPT